MATDFARVRATFEAAVELPVAQRAAFLVAQCAGDDELRTEVEQLLASDTSTTPLAAALDGTAAQLTQKAAPLLDTTIANFRLQSVLGSGGMGTVYAAEQQEPRRQVALKVMSLGLLDKAAVARFRFEAELLARLRHPAIAQIYAAGVHKSGDVELPWFALELVAGATDLVTHSARHDLTVGARLELLLQVCDAVHHGHLQGIVHRDLKPQNVLVDGDGRVKVIDFGIARSTAGNAGDAPPTERGFVLGTLAYMSPEQIDGVAVDHRTDVWALGVLAYELLTGHRPFEFAGVPPWRAAELMATTAPKPLSALVPGLPADLDVVVAKALRAVVAERYESAAAFAADLRAVLAERPVSARPASAFYHVRMFARRRRGVVAAIAAITVTVLVALVVLVIQNQALQRQHRQSARLAKFASDFLLQADPKDHGADYKVRDALDRAARAIEREAFPEPAVAGELQMLLGDAYRGLGLPAKAIPHLERAATTFRTEHGASHRRTIAAEISLASARCEIDRAGSAAADLDTIVTNAAANLEADDPELLRALHNQAFAWRAAGRYVDAERQYREVMLARERVLGPNNPDTIATMHNLGNLLLAMQRPEEAHTVLKECLRRSRNSDDSRESTWMIADNFGETLRALGRLDEAEAMHREAIAGCEELLGPDHETTIGCGYHLLKVLFAARKVPELAALATTLLARCERTFGPDHRHTMDVLSAVAAAKKLSGDTAGAVADCTRSYTTMLRQLGELHPDTFINGHNLAEAQLAAKDPAAALVTTTQLQDALVDASDLPPVMHGYTRLLHARALAANGRSGEAEAEATAARDHLLQCAPDHKFTQQAKQLVVELVAARAGG